MIVKFLGTGTSHGIPMLGCSCSVCTSGREKDTRYRCSILLEKDGKRIVIDTGYEFRLQMIRENIKNIDAVIYTHSHLDHIAGLDDLRVFSAGKKFPIYCSIYTLKYLEIAYPYIFGQNEGRPNLKAHVVESFKHYNIEGFDVTAVEVNHTRSCGFKTMAYRIGSLGYITDCTYISDEGIEVFKGVDTLIVGALQKEPHNAHYSFAEAYELGKKIGAKHIYFTHINHKTSYDEINTLFPGALSAYDGLCLNIPGDE